MMASTPTSTQSAQNYEPPQNTQFSVFLDNKVGKLNHLIGIMKAPALTLAGFSVVDAADHAVVRILTSRATLAKRILEQNDLAFSHHDVLVVELSNNTTLQDICNALLTAEVNIQYAYPLLVRPRNCPAIVIHTDDITFATHFLRKRLFTLLGENDLGENASQNTTDDTPDSPSSSTELPPTDDLDDDFPTRS
ncbi:hypothetical protein KS4_29660 [Poriferisphaera corsica]|uniref:ACT domain-containing protein n=1 Tax=Poriferisphaera corsica TaxID=2528020 RepID=A0A517YXF1_9BACT|nr:hypothetical protein [Poriferisphaera corsica]QDU34890.1 hypothetical protein KS4_29660 [Poriferisphaera corsica]